MLLRLYPDNLEVLIILLPTLIFSLCFHEFAHGFAAYKLGDNTANLNGRLTMNPLAHLDPIGTIMILFVGFGWAKPVPVNQLNFKNPRKDMVIVAAAGPISNLVLAFIGGLIFRVLNLLSIYNSQIIFTVLYFFIIINISLAIFNLIPIVPLDGSRIFENILIKKYPHIVRVLNVYGPNILLGLILFGIITGFSIIWIIMKPFISILLFVFAGI